MRSEATPAFSPRDLRDALAYFATGVTIVTALDADSHPIGMTASSFNSVSVDPPLVLWSVTNSALSAKAFIEAEHFGIHVLGAHQTETANHFASRGCDKFAQVDYTTSPEGIPQINGCLVRFDCKRWAVYAGGDHTIIVGEVMAIHREQGDGLIFHQGIYATSVPMRLPAKSGGDIEQALGHAPIEDMLLYQLSRAYRQLSSQFHLAVHESGLSLPEWRVLASLSGGFTRNLASLSRRTFVDLESLQDTVARLEEAGLCRIEQPAEETLIYGTPAGEKRVAHLFDLSVNQETHALDGAAPKTRAMVMDALRLIVKNS